MVASADSGSAWSGSIVDWVDEEKDIKWLERKKEELYGC